MKTSPACLPCFRRQAQYALPLATSDPALHEIMGGQIEQLLTGLDMSEAPPVNSIGLYRIISQVSQNPDPFSALKQRSNDLALRLRPIVENLIHQGGDPLYRSLLFAIAGNIIDYGSQQDFDLDGALRQCLHNEPVINDYQALRRELAQARTILYLADNCGEIVFDGLVIDQLPAETTLVVKDGPIINDATAAEAVYCGLGQKCRVISNGVVCPGTPLARCGQELQDLFEAADVVISKGQGNFETLSEVKRPVYHLLTIKCPVVASHAAEVTKSSGPIPVGAAVLMRLAL